MRKLVFVPVSTQPKLEGCWSVNITESGIGLVARQANEGSPQEGETVELAFPLPTGPQIFARGVVRWRLESDRADAGVTSFGIRFESFEGTSQVDLLRFLAEYRVRVVVSGADRSLGRALELALGMEVQLEFIDDAAALESSLFRGDVSALLLCGEEFQSLALAHLVESTSRAATLELGRPAETKPRVIFAGRTTPGRLVELFNVGAVDQALPPDAPVTQMADAVRQECRTHGMRLQQQRMAVELERVLRDRGRPLSSVPEGNDSPGFTSAAMREVVGQVRQVAGYKVTVLLQGETGAGKEVIAQRIHALSPRVRRPFVVQDCGALVENLLDSELFGHVKGAFTGAVADHPGLFVLADGGTIFLDEIENTTPNLQAKLLRVLEVGEVRPVGGSSVKRVDVRVVVASNKALNEEVERGRFRADLYYRLNSFLVEVPPLREREQDILPLARAFIDTFNRALGKSARAFTPEAEATLTRWKWAGNVRELRNVVERAVLLSGPMEQLGRERLPKAMQGGPVSGAANGIKSLKVLMENTEKNLILEALQRHGGVLRRAAKDLDVDPQTFARRARRLGAI